MENVVDILNAVDSPWSLLTLLILGFFALMWKFGKEILSLLKETRTVAKDVQQSIITNHGSKNIGDAIDRLTEWQMQQQTQDAEDRLLVQGVAQQLEHDRQLMRDLTKTVDKHIAESEPIRTFVQEIQEEQRRLRRDAAEH